jgi:hypothetical protein
VNTLSESRLVITSLCAPADELLKPAQSPPAMHIFVLYGIQVRVTESPGLIGFLSTLISIFGLTFTLTVLLTCPEALSHVKVKFLLKDVRLPETSYPEFAFEPDHEPAGPEATQEESVIFIVLQFKVVGSLYTTVLGLAVNITLGNIFRSTVFETVPYGLVHVRTNLLFSFTDHITSSGKKYPRSSFLPVQSPDAIHSSAPTGTHVNTVF